MPLLFLAGRRRHLVHLQTRNRDQMREKKVLLITFLYVVCLPMARPNCTSLTDGIDAYTLSAADGGLPAKCKVRLHSASDNKNIFSADCHQMHIFSETCKNMLILCPLCDLTCPRHTLIVHYCISQPLEVLYIFFSTVHSIASFTCPAVYISTLDHVGYTSVEYLKAGHVNDAMNWTGEKWRCRI